MRKIVTACFYALMIGGGAAAAAVYHLRRYPDPPQFIEANQRPRRLCQKE